MRKILLAVPALATLLLSACPSPTAYKGPPPEYEAPKPFGSATGAPAAPKTSDAPPPYGTPEALGKNIDAYMSGFGSKWGESYAASGVLVVARAGEPVVVRSYGKADREKNVAFNVDTRLKIGSLTKQFTAAAVLKLVETGKLSTSDSIRRLVKELPEPYEPVTVHHLLAQTSGVPSFTDDPAMLGRRAEDVPAADVLSWLSMKTPDYAPGARFAYSNSNYYLLGLVVERVTKKPLSAALDELVFTPAVMKSTGVDPKGVAVGYMRDIKDALVPAGPVSDAFTSGAGMLRSSAHDLLLWDRALETDAVLAQASRNALFTGVSKCPQCGGGDYAYGFIVENLKGTKVEWHDGAIDGYTSFFARAPEKGLAVIVLSNSSGFLASTAGRAVLSMSLGGDPVAPIVERDLAKIEEPWAKGVAGEYVLTKESRTELASKLPTQVIDSIEGMDVQWADGLLTFKPVGQGRFSLRKAADGSLFNTELGVDIAPDFGDPKKPQKKTKGLSLKQGPMTIQYVRGKLPAKAKDKTAETPKKPAEKKPADKKAEKTAEAPKKPAPKK